MNKDAIRNTAVCRVDENEGLFVVESPLLEICAGVDEDKERAWKIFHELLDAMYVEYLEGKAVGRYERRGRPPKGGTILSVSVRPSTKAEVEELAQQLSCSQGEVVDFLYAFYAAAQTMPAGKAKAGRAAESVANYIAEPEVVYTARTAKRAAVVKGTVKGTLAKRAKGTK